MNDEKLTWVAEFRTGSRRGYIPAAERGIPGDLIPLSADLTGLRGNLRQATEKFLNAGATHYTVTWFQGVPYRGYSSKYCYMVYTGYRVD